MLVLILEASTSSAKALLYDDAKGVIASTTLPYDASINTVATQDADGVLDAVLNAGRSIASGKDIAAIGLCGTWHSIMICDKRMRPVSPTFSWACRDSIPTTARIRADKALTNELYQRTGCMIHSTYGFYALLHLKENGADLSDKYFASQSGYIFYKLTGERIESDSTMAGSSLLNVNDKGYDPLVLSMLGVEAVQFGSLASYRETRPLLDHAAMKLGVKSGIPVVPSYPDGAMNQVGSGALKKGIMTISVGTSAAMRFTVDKPILPRTPSTWCYVGVDSWVSGAAISGACSCVDWFRRSVGGRQSFHELEAAASEAPTSPIFLPFIFGERCPGWQDEKLGGFFDLSREHGVGALYKGLLEGICFNLRQCFSVLTSLAGEPTQIRLSGGIVKSPLWTHLLADILEKDLQVSNFNQASSLGTAALALNACGVLENLSDFTASSFDLVHPSAMGRYEKAYERYLQWYDSTK